MSKLTSFIAVLLFTLAVSSSPLTLENAQMRPLSLGKNPFTMTQDLLKAFYPEAFGNKWQVNFSASQPVDDDVWGNFSGCEFEVKRFSSGVSFSPVWDESTHKFRTPPENTIFLEGSSWIGAHGEVIRFLAKGDLARSQQNESIRKLVESHPEWSEDRAIQALKEAGARYGPDAKQLFIDSLRLTHADIALGNLEINKAEFATLANPGHVGSFAELYWVVYADVKLPGGTQGQYAFEFEPFEGKLTGISFIHDPAPQRSP